VSRRFRPWAILGLLNIPLHGGNAFARNGALAGSLERVRYRSVSIRLADGRLIDAVLLSGPDLSAGVVAARFNVGDQVQFRCRPIQAVYDPAAALHLHLELKDLEAAEFCGRRNGQAIYQRHRCRRVVA
jgi:hypothetical protein